MAATFSFETLELLERAQQAINVANALGEERQLLFAAIRTERLGLQIALHQQHPEARDADKLETRKLINPR